MGDVSERALWSIWGCRAVQTDVQRASEWYLGVSARIHLRFPSFWRPFTSPSVLESTGDVFVLIGGMCAQIRQVYFLQSFFFLRTFFFFAGGPRQHIWELLYRRYLRHELCYIFCVSLTSSSTRTIAFRRGEKNAIHEASRNGVLSESEWFAGNLQWHGVSNVMCVDFWMPFRVAGLCCMLDFLSPVVNFAVRT